MKAVILTGGSIQNYEAIRGHIQPEDFVICADRGYDHAVKMGIKPQRLVGDMDSISAVPEGIPCEKYPSEKDETDTEIALNTARRLGYHSFTLLGATGSRLDHTIANIHLLKDCLERGELAQIIDDHNRIFLIKDRIELTGKAGQLVSLLPFTHCSGVTSKNLQYPLQEAELPMGKVMGVSNVMLEEYAEVSVRKGYLLVILPHD